MKLLICAFYFPPAGGGGVQRPLRFAQHLAALGVETHVLAPSDSRWIHRDEELALPANVRVHRARYLGPRGRLPAEELHNRHGLDRLARQLSLTPRRLLVPDENVGWLLTAIGAASRIVRREQIDVLLTTSPPSSVHLIGAAAKRTTGVRWVADLRDSMLANPNRRVARLARIKERSHNAVAHLVARQADATVAVTETIAAEIGRLGSSGKLVVIPNGCDFDDFAGLEYRRGERFRITHTGSFFGPRDPRPFLRALAQLDADIVARFVGDFRAADRLWASSLGLGNRLELHPFQPHAQTLALQRDSEALLLLLPEIGERGRDVPSGKIYEYLAAERPILAAVPPSGTAARLVRECDAGVVVAPDDVEGIAGALASLENRWRAGDDLQVRLAPSVREALSRQSRAAELAELVTKLAE